MVTRPRAAVVALGLSSALLVATVAASGVTSSDSGIDVAAVGTRPPLVSVESTRRSLNGDRGDDAGRPGPSGTLAFRELPQPDVTAPVAPVSLRIPRLGVRAIVVPTGVSPAGQAEIPENVDVVGWYRFGAGPADARGSTVLIGHRDGRGQGRGVLYDLGSVEVGDPITVTLPGGRLRTYVVVARESFPKPELPVAELFSRDGPARISIISCGGAYDAARGGYQSNVVVTAVPTAAR